MKKKLYLHIGMGKTGTTALQSFFFENRRSLQKRGIEYPSIGCTANAHHLLSPHHPEFLQGWRFLSVDQWAPKLSRTRYDTVLASSELMSSADESKVRKFCAQVSAWFDLHIVVYLRRQDDLIMASYNQQIKAGTQKRHLSMIYPKQAEKYNYFRILAPWIDSVAPGRVIARPYEKEQFYSSDLRRDFMHHVFGLELDESFTLSSEDSNPSLGYLAGEFKRLINLVAPDPDKNAALNQLLMAYVDDGSGGEVSARRALNAEQRQEIMTAVDDGNRLIARELMQRETGILFRQKTTASNDLMNSSELSQAEANSIAAFFYRQDSTLAAWLIKQTASLPADATPMTRRSAAILRRGFESIALNTQD